eukprot:scaffold87382_cov15-Tisochrysis_lutea.AAC.1
MLAAADGVCEAGRGGEGELVGKGAAAGRAGRGTLVDWFRPRGACSSVWTWWLKVLYALSSLVRPPNENKLSCYPRALAAVASRLALCCVLGWSCRRAPSQAPLRFPQALVLAAAGAVVPALEGTVAAA